MIVWVLVIIATQGNGYSGPAVAIIDNIASAESCEQLANVHREYSRYGRRVTATCSPVRKVRP